MSVTLFLGYLNRYIWGEPIVYPIRNEKDLKENHPILFIHGIFWWYGMVNVFLELNHTGVLSEILEVVRSGWDGSSIKTLIIVLGFVYIFLVMFFSYSSSNVENLYSQKSD